MQVNYDTNYKRSLKLFEKKYKYLIPIIDETIEILRTNNKDSRLHYKKMNCKKDKIRHSIRVINQPFRILLRAFENEYRLICVCDHDKYDRYNKNC